MFLIHTLETCRITFEREPPWEDDASNHLKKYFTEPKQTAIISILLHNLALVFTAPLADPAVHIFPSSFNFFCDV